jgi:hypothetical protein
LGASLKMNYEERGGRSFRHAFPERQPGRLHPSRAGPHLLELFRRWRLATIGQGQMSIGGGGYGGGGLPYPSEVLQLWGGASQTHTLTPPAAPRVVRHDGSGKKSYAVVAIGPQGHRTAPSSPVSADGRATLSWDSTTGADAYPVLCNGQVITEPLRIEGSTKQWTDTATNQ